MTPSSHTLFRFSIGNTILGAVGAAISICSDTPEHALQQLRNSIDPDMPFVVQLLPNAMGTRAMNYYIDPEHIRLSDIVESTSCDCQYVPGWNTETK